MDELVYIDENTAGMNSKIEETILYNKNLS